MFTRKKEVCYAQGLGKLADVRAWHGDREADERSGDRRVRDRRRRSLAREPHRAQGPDPRQVEGSDPKPIPRKGDGLFIFRAHFASFSYSFWDFIAPIAQW